MLNHSPQRKETLFRKLEGRNRKEKYLRKITSLIDGDINPINFVSLEYSDFIANAIVKKNKKATKINVSSFYEIIDFFKEKLSKNEFYILMDCDWKYCGMYKANAGSAYNRSYDFIGLGVDDIELLVADMSFCIHIEYYHDSVTDTYQLTCELITYQK